jgi:hypothetical protein
LEKTDVRQRRAKLSEVSVLEDKSMISNLKEEEKIGLSWTQCEDEKSDNW